jgi:predicted glutamine amidotransferase
VCRLFGMSGGRNPVAATFWLLGASDSLARQSHREPDGTGLGAFRPDGTPLVAKQPIAAYEDRAFATEAREIRSRTFVAHVRYASNGAVAAENTHPFEQDGRLFAHNGVIGETERLDAELGQDRSLVQGQTDSERFFALITREARRLSEAQDGEVDLGAAIASAAGWIAAHLPVYALNCVLITPEQLWALRYPDTHELHVLQRPAGGPGGGRHLDHRGTPHELRVHSAELAEQASVVVASEPMDDDPGWRALAPGELLHVDAALTCNLSNVLPDPPARRLDLATLDPRAAASQRPSGATGPGDGARG